MKDDKILEEIQSCLDCKECVEVCDTFAVTNNELQSPNGRLKIAGKVFNNDEITEDERFSLYTCTLCGSCDLACVQSINISKIIHASKVKLVEQNKAPFEVHEKIIKGIIKNYNSVGGNPDDRLDWLPEKYRKNELFEDNDSDTLLFFGCMSSFKVKESSSASYEILKKAGINFKILKNEPCCGEYVYSAGKLKLAEKMMQENFELFKKIGVKNLIVTCGGCLYAFNNLYPEHVKDWNINVKHVVQVIYDLEKEGKLQFNPLNKEITYHDACRMGRKLKNIEIYDEPRELLKKCGLILNDFKLDRKYTQCCGAGSGIRGVDSNLCQEIGSNLINQAKTEEIASSCPLCVFNFRYVDYKRKLNKKFRYITDYILEAIIPNKFNSK
ncbi:MAG: (Fe-S)-binding protein [Promethearchaeota archaeon]